MPGLKQEQTQELQHLTLLLEPPEPTELWMEPPLGPPRELEHLEEMMMVWKLVMMPGLVEVG